MLCVYEPFRIACLLGLSDLDLLDQLQLILTDLYSSGSASSTATKQLSLVIFSNSFKLGTGYPCNVTALYSCSQNFKEIPQGTKCTRKDRDES